MRARFLLSLARSRQFPLFGSLESVTGFVTWWFRVFGLGTGSTEGVDVLGPFSLLTVIGKEWRPLYQPGTPVVPWHADVFRQGLQ